MEWKKEVGLVAHQGQGGGAKPRLKKEQKKLLKQVLIKEGKFWTLGRIRNLVLERFGVSYGKRQMQRILRQLGMYCYKPQPRDYRQSSAAEQQLKDKLQAVFDVLMMKEKDISNLCIGFADESSPQLHANSSRLWCFQKGLHKQVNTDRKKQNNFGFYALKGNSLILPIQKGNEATMLDALGQIKIANPQASNIIVIWDNHKAHLTKKVNQLAFTLGIVLVNLPAYSPNLNPIERIWKQVKRAISEEVVIENIEKLQQIIDATFRQCSQKISFAESWIENIFNTVFKNYPIAFSDKLWRTL